jgi:maltose alpha-D-glucosyltransferase/alpha-amylase
LRSIDYAGATLIDRKGIGAMPVDEARRNRLVSQFRDRASTAFLRAYRNATNRHKDTVSGSLLDLFLIEKAAYEIVYEATNRPSWIGVPIAGLARITASMLRSDSSALADIQ